MILSTEYQEKSCFHQSMNTNSFSLLCLCFLFVQLVENALQVYRVRGKEISEHEKGVFHNLQIQILETYTKPQKKCLNNDGFLSFFFFFKGFKFLFSNSNFTTSSHVKGGSRVKLPCRPQLELITPWKHSTLTGGLIIQVGIRHHCCFQVEATSLALQFTSYLLQKIKSLRGINDQI